MINSNKKHFKLDMINICKLAYNENLVAGTSGNASIFIEDEGIMLITPSGVIYNTMTCDDIVEMTLDGNILLGSKPSSEWKMHAEIYKNLKNVKSILHTHSPYATSFAVCRKEIPVVLIEMVYFLKGEVPTSAFAIPGTAQVGLNAIEPLKTRNACLMENHGVVAIGESISEAYTRAVYVEDAAKIFHLATNIGAPFILPEECVKSMQ